MGFHTLEEMLSNNFPTMNPNTKTLPKQQLQIESSVGSTKINNLIDKDSFNQKWINGNFLIISLILKHAKWLYHFIKTKNLSHC